MIEVVNLNYNKLLVEYLVLCKIFFSYKEKINIDN